MTTSKFFIFFAICGLSLLTGCFALHQGMITGTATLSSNNFTIVEQGVHGESSTLIVFGIGGLERDRLVNDAKKDLFKTNPLQKNQALANVVLDFKSTVLFFGLGVQQECFITADIVEFH